MGWLAWVLVALAVTAALYALFLGSLIAAGRNEEARALARLVPDCAVLVARLLRDPRVHRGRKALLLLLVAYLALPFDLVPDVIPVAGQLDDAIIVALALRGLLRSGGEPLVRELWPGPEQTLDLVLRLAR